MIYILFFSSIILKIFAIIFNINSLNNLILSIIIYLMFRNKTLISFLLIIYLIVVGYIYTVNNFYSYLFIYSVFSGFLFFTRKYIKNNDIIYISTSILLITILEFIIEWDLMNWRLFLWHFFSRLIIMSIVYFILNRDKINEKL